MEKLEDIYEMLDLMIRPGFCVRDNRILHVNQAAGGLLLFPGDDIRSLLLTGAEEYEAFEGGCLYLKLNLCSHGCGTSVIRRGEVDIFLPDQDSDDAALQAMALAARELRGALTTVMASADGLSVSQEDPEAKAHAARMNRGLHQLLRIVGNMSDAGRSAASSQQQIHNIGRLFSEIFDKAAGLIEHADVRLSFTGLSEEIYCLADAAQLERAVLNILSNAVKFTPKGGFVEASLSRSGRILRLSVQDSGSGIAENILTSLFSRYLRQPGIEDSRYGIGLGMVLVRSAAANHGGTVLIDCPQGKGTRVSLTMAIRQNTGSPLCSPILRVDYAGERDHGLIELSDCLPPAVYEPDK